MQSGVAYLRHAKFLISFSTDDLHLKAQSKPGKTLREQIKIEKISNVQYRMMKVTSVLDIQNSVFDICYLPAIITL